MTKRPSKQRQKTGITNYERVKGMAAAIRDLYGRRAATLDAEACLIDALTDLRHWWHSRCVGGNDSITEQFEDAVRMSRNHFVIELAEEAEEQQ